MNLRRVRAILDVNQLATQAVVERAQANHDGMAADTATYAAPVPGLPAYQTLITNVVNANALVRLRTVGAAANRDVQRNILWSAMESERLYIQSLVDANPGRGVALIQNGGLVVAQLTVRQKPALALTNGTQSGSVACVANVGLLLAGSSKPNEAKYFGWQYTLDGSKTFVTVPSTPKGKTLISGLPTLVEVGVRVNMTNTTDGTLAWSQVLPTHLVEHLPALELRVVA
jgi:hypothetical protein